MPARYDLALLVFRIGLILVYPISGYYKIVNWPTIVNVLGSQGLPLPLFGGVLAVGVEMILPILVILGIQTRFAAIGLLLYTLGATAIGNRFWEATGPAQLAQTFTFFKNLGVAGGFMLLALLGPGRFALGRKP